MLAREISADATDERQPPLTKSAARAVPARYLREFSRHLQLVWTDISNTVRRTGSSIGARLMVERLGIRTPR